MPQLVGTVPVPDPVPKWCSLSTEWVRAVPVPDLLPVPDPVFMSITVRMLFFGGGGGPVPDPLPVLDPVPVRNSMDL